MAYMIPLEPPSKRENLAERRIFIRFRDELPRSYIVLHSLGIARHKRKRWGESDFVVIGPKGIFVLEIKGGNVECKDGIWKIGSYKKKESPWSQASSGMFSIIKELEDNGFPKGYLFGNGVIFPDQKFSVSGSEINLEVLLEASNWHRNIYDFILKLEEYWINWYQEKWNQFPSELDKIARQKARTILRPDITSIFSLSSKFNNIVSELINLTQKQKIVLDGLRRNRRTVIIGSAGSGKTVLAVEKSVSLAADGKKVLLLCFNRNLRDHLLESIGDALDFGSGSLVVQSLHSWYRGIIVSAGLEKQLDELSESCNEIEIFNVVFPLLFMDAFVKIKVDLYDAIVIDEAQDILNKHYLQTFDLILKGGMSEGIWHLFWDDNQNLYSPEDKESVKNRLGEFGHATYVLNQNCRNTREVALKTVMVSGIIFDASTSVEGGNAEEIYYDSKEDLISKLGIKVESYKERGIDTKNMIILSPNNFDKSVLADFTRIDGYRIMPLGKSTTGSKTIDFCTIHSFKGLERNVVLYVDINENNVDQPDEMFYVGLSRARIDLILFISVTAKTSYRNKIRKFGRKIASDESFL